MEDSSCSARAEAFAPRIVQLFHRSPEHQIDVRLIWIVGMWLEVIADHGLPHPSVLGL